MNDLVTVLAALLVVALALTGSYALVRALIAYAEHRARR